MSKQVRKCEGDAAPRTTEFAEALLRASSDGIVITGASRSIVVVNEAFCALFDQRREEVTGTNLGVWLQRLDPEAPRRWTELEKRLRLGEACRDVGFETSTKNGGRHLSVNASPLELGTEQQGVIVSMWRDITERERAREALRVSEQRYAIATRAAKVGVWDWNVETGEFYLDPNIKATLGYRDEEIPNDLDVWTTYVHEDDREPVMEAARAHLEGRTPEYVFEHRMLHRDGTVRWILVRGKAIRDAEGNVVRMVGSDTDITDRKRAEQELAGVAEELKRSNVELEQFGYVISHDLRAPLRSLMSYARLLQEDGAEQLSEDARACVAGVAQCAQQMEALVVDLLEYARIGRTQLELSEVDLGDLLEQIVTRLGLREQAEVRLPADAPPVRARVLRLRQIFANLLDNAARFRQADRPLIVTVAWADRELEWEFAVRDNGVGIPKAHTEDIFRMFRRLHTQEERDGTGIGLAIVKKAVEEHGGRVWVESASGEGSTFRFTLPKSM